MASSGGDSHLVIRAAFDVGSGKTKMDVCTVDVHRNVIVNTLYSEQIDVPFALDMLEGGAGGGGGGELLSEDILERGMSALVHLKARANQLGASAYAGIATAVFRRATNGADFLARAETQLAIRLSVVSQAVEGEVGYLTAESTTTACFSSNSNSTPSSGHEEDKRGHPSSSSSTTTTSSSSSSVIDDAVIAYDSGAASFQLTTPARGVVSIENESCVSSATAASTTASATIPTATSSEAGIIQHDTGSSSSSMSDSYLVYEGPWGSASALQHLLTRVQNGVFSEGCTANPVKVEHVDAAISSISAILPSIPDWLQRAVSNGRTCVAMGGPTSMFNIAKVALAQRSTFTCDEIEEATRALAGHSDVDMEMAGFPEPKLVVPKLCLLAAVLRATGIDHVTYTPTNGGCRGVLLSKSFWRD
eukprot:UC1_evm2s1739